VSGAVDLDRAIERALRELDLDPSCRRDVLALLESPRDAWPACCGSLCDPCVLTLARAADRVRELCPDAEGS
jgi:hypothetical protein